MPEASIKVTTTVPGVHFWKDAPQSRHYLRHPHRHMFFISAYVSVSEPDRQIEFHDLVDRIRFVVHLKSVSLDGLKGIRNFGGQSCETIAEKILANIPEATKVTVSEDQECEATVIRKSAKPKVLTVCGSTRFREEYEKALWNLEMRGIAAFSVGGYTQADQLELSHEAKKEADDLHKRKIEMSDGIYVVNPGGYVGESTRGEILHAHKLGKEIYFEHPMDITIDEMIITGKHLTCVSSPRQEVLSFSHMMEEKLAKKDYKGGWQGRGLREMFTRIRGEMMELEEALDQNKFEDAIQETVDVANMSMMLSTLLRKEIDTNDSFSVEQPEESCFP